MKHLILTSILLANSTSFAATDWQTLINIAPNLKKESMDLDSKGYIKADVVKMPSGKYRFIGFTSFLAAKKPILTLEVSPKTDINELCKNAVFFDKKFDAQLTVQTQPLVTNPKLLFSPDLNSFENPVKIGPAKITFTKKTTAWTLHDYVALANSKGRQLTDYYEDILNAQLQQAATGVLKLDMSNMNAFACDLAQGNLVFSVNRTAEFEAGLPVKQNWIDLNQFTAVFQSFWKLQPKVTDVRIAPAQNDLAEAVALGVAARRTDLGEALVQSPARLQKFLASVKADARGLNATQKATARTTEVTDNWIMNSEYTKPATETVQQNLLVGEDAAFVKYED